MILFKLGLVADRATESCRFFEMRRVRLDVKLSITLHAGLIVI